MKQVFVLTCLISVVAFGTGHTQTSDNMKLPYYEIPDYPESYSATTVTARLVDGLGFRYYWATEGLRPEDLAYKPSETGRTCLETLDHIYGLTTTLLNAVKKQPNDRSVPRPELDYAEMREATLMNIKMASDILRESDDSEMEDMDLVFKRGTTSSEFPFWNMLNGPLADAMWHTGQIVVLRRASGNPFNSRVSVFQGRLRQ